MKQPQPCRLVYKLVKKRHSARGTKWSLVSFQTLIWPSCFLSFPEFVFLVLAETPAHMDSADPGPETPLTVSSVVVNGESLVIVTFPSISEFPTKSHKPALSWAQAKRQPPGTVSRVLTQDTEHVEGWCQLRDRAGPPVSLTPSKPPSSSWSPEGVGKPEVSYFFWWRFNLM